MRNVDIARSHTTALLQLINVTCVAVRIAQPGWQFLPGRRKLVVKRA